MEGWRWARNRNMQIIDLSCSQEKCGHLEPTFVLRRCINRKKDRKFEIRKITVLRDFFPKAHV
jgi:hypothetical protein